MNAGHAALPPSAWVRLGACAAGGALTLILLDAPGLALGLLVALPWSGCLIGRAHSQRRTLAPLGVLSVLACLGFAAYAVCWLAWTTLLNL